MSQWDREHPEESLAISQLPPSQQLAARHASVPDPLEAADRLRDECLCNFVGPDSFGNYDHVVNPACPLCGGDEAA